MGNSPAPRPSYKEYGDINMDIVSCNKVADSYNIVFDVTNTGDSYLSYYGGGAKTVYFNVMRKESNNYETLQCQMVDALFEKQTVGPKQVIRYATSSAKELTNEELQSFYTYSLDIEDKDIVYSNTKISLNNAETKSYIFTMKNKGLGDYYYAVVVDIAYQEKTYSIVLNSQDQDSKGKYYFTANELLDLDKLDIANIRFFRSGYKTYKGGQVLQGIIIFIVVCFILFILMGLAAAIVLPIVITNVRRKRRRRNESLSLNNQNNKE